MSERPSIRARAKAPAGAPATAAAAISLRLYVASATPNSERAKANLDAMLRDLGNAAGRFIIEVVDVLADGRRAVTDSVIVTPTLVAVGARRRLALIGDLGDRPRLEAFLRSAGSAG